MSDVRPSAGAGERLWVARLPVTLRSACLGAWIVAAAGPRVGAARSETRSEGISIVLCVDLSSSMLAERSEEHTSELQSLRHLVCRLLLEKKKQRVEPLGLCGTSQ